jgi:hypothetical protein
LSTWVWEIRESEYVRDAHGQPWDHFGAEVVED